MESRTRRREIEWCSVKSRSWNNCLNEDQWSRGVKWWSYAVQIIIHKIKLINYTWFYIPLLRFFYYFFANFLFHLRNWEHYGYLYSQEGIWHIPKRCTDHPDLGPRSVESVPPVTGEAFPELCGRKAEEWVVEGEVERKIKIKKIIKRYAEIRSMTAR